jgi:hypothetical protein
VLSFEEIQHLDNVRLELSLRYIPPPSSPAMFDSREESLISRVLELESIAPPITALLEVNWQPEHVAVADSK